MTVREVLQSLWITIIMQLCAHALNSLQWLTTWNANGGENTSPVNPAAMPTVRNLRRRAPSVMPRTLCEDESGGDSRWKSSRHERLKSVPNRALRGKSPIRIRGAHSLQDLVVIATAEFGGMEMAMDHARAPRPKPHTPRIAESKSRTGKEEIGWMSEDSENEMVKRKPLGLVHVRFDQPPGPYKCILHVPSHRIVDNGKILLDLFEHMSNWVVQPPANGWRQIHHARCSVMLKLPWPIVLDAAAEDVETFVETVNRVEGTNVFSVFSVLVR